MNQRQRIKLAIFKLRWLLFKRMMVLYGQVFCLKVVSGTCVVAMFLLSLMGAGSKGAIPKETRSGNRAIGKGVV